MVGGLIGNVPGSLALLARRGRWWRLSWSCGHPRGVRRSARRTAVDEEARRLYQFRYHLGRGRRAREAGRFENGVTQARRALALNPRDPWALALLGQCLHRQRASDLDGARRALECAWSLDPTNGYFVRLLLDVLSAQGDPSACLDLLTWAWWRGAPVERWLPNGPPRPHADRGAAESDAVRNGVRPAPPAVPTSGSASGTPLLAGRQPAPAYAG
jgi:tetratricopeptide (TPR) repeat protein